MFVLDIRKLNMLAELDRLGTITAVAKSLNLTAPGISMQLASLEREIGVKLTERQGRRIVVTPAGRLLARHGSGIVDMLAVAEMEIASSRKDWWERTGSPPSRPPRERFCPVPGKPSLRPMTVDCNSGSSNSNQASRFRH